MPNPEIFDDSAQQLDRILGFFNRVEAKAGALFAVNLGMLGYMVSKVNLSDFEFPAVVIFGAISFLLLGLSIWYIYWTFFPDLHHGMSFSLAYFGYISALPREDFFRQMREASREKYLEDVLDQVWRNAGILQKKFTYIKKASFCTALAVPFWLLFLLTINILVISPHLQLWH